METQLDSSIVKMERARASLNAVLEKVAPQAEIYPTWKLKQLLDHFAGWDELVYSTLRAYLQGEAPSLAVKGGINHYNAESVTARKSLSLEQSRKAYDTLRELVIETLQKVPPEMYGQQFPAPWGGMCTIPGIVKIFTSHELSHAKQIKKVLKSTTSL